MSNDWIAFYRDGKMLVDVVLAYGKDTGYPYSDYAITPHHGQVDRCSIIETRSSAIAKQEVGRE